MNDVASLWDLSNEEEIHHFKNESLGMAFLHLCHLAICLGVPLKKVARKIRYRNGVETLCRRLEIPRHWRAKAGLAYCHAFIHSADINQAPTVCWR